VRGGASSLKNVRMKAGEFTSGCRNKEVDRRIAIFPAKNDGNHRKFLLPWGETWGKRNKVVLRRDVSKTTRRGQAPPNVRFYYGSSI